jgi:DNA-binding cell septation regulator SpoVG
MALEGREEIASLTISNWKRFEKNTLRGLFTVTLPSGMIIHKVSLHEKNGQRWIGLPYEKREGDTAFKPLVEFTSRSVADSFRRQVVDALKALGHV